LSRNRARAIVIALVFMMASVTLLEMPIHPVKAQISLTPEVALRYPEQIRDAGGSTAVPAGVTDRKSVV
jgi:hypothetical protein